MDFWGKEVIGTRPLKDSSGDGMVLHLSGAAIGTVKEEERVAVQLCVKPKNKQKIVIGTLFSDKLPQQQFDLILDTDFYLSHNWEAGSVFFYGYKANHPFAESDEDQSDPFFDKGKGKGKRKFKTVDENESYDASEESKDEAGVESGDEETSKKGQSGKKEAADKKATVTQQKNDGKRGCKSCNRRFGTVDALKDHTRAKHSN